MRRTTCMLVASLAGATWALESSYTGPLFDASQAPYFDYNSLVVPTQTTLPAIQPTAEFSMATTIEGIVLPSTSLSRSVASSSSRDAAATASRASSASGSVSSAAISASASSASASSASASSASASSASASAPAQQSTGAAVANRVGVVGAVAGGLLAGLALA